MSPWQFLIPPLLLAFGVSGDGGVGGDGSFEVVLGLPQRNLERLETVFWDVSNPSSPSYLQHLSLPQLSALIGATQDDINSASDWLISMGASPSSLRVSALKDTVRAVFASENAVSPEHREQVWKVRQSSGLRIPARANHTRPLDFLLRLDPNHSEQQEQEQQQQQQQQQEQRQAVIGAEDSPYSIKQQKQAYKMPADLSATHPDTLQMVWGPGTFGYSQPELEYFRDSQCPLLNVEKVHTDGFRGRAGGDNYGEGNLDIHMIASFGLNVSTLVSNTNTSASTEEGTGFGLAFLNFLTDLSARDTVPQVLSLSLGSLSAYSCDLLCSEAVKLGQKLTECQAYLQEQRQVCMYISEEQIKRINTALQVLGARGVTVFGASGDGGSHWSFREFSPSTEMGRVLNKVGCAFQFPIFPSPSPYMVSVGGTEWTNNDPTQDPITWPGSGGGFSWQFTRPDYQNKSVDSYLQHTEGLPPLSSFQQKGRAYPDISAVGVSGTSMSSPTIAGIFSMIMDHRLNTGLKPLGFLGPRIWSTAEQYPGEAFQSVKVGNSKTTCDNGFPSTEGWDPNTGWGRPVWTGILEHFGSDELSQYM